MEYNQKQGFTLIELIMAMIIIGILSVSGASLMLYMVKHSTLIPRELNTDMIAMQAANIMIEGDIQAKGLRFSRSISAIEDNQITFNNQDNQSILLQLDTGTDTLYRQVDGNPSAVIPYYASSDFNVLGKDDALFTYYDTDENVIDPSGGDPADVRRITMSLIAQTGTGVYDEWEGQTEIQTSISVNRY